MAGERVDTERVVSLLGGARYRLWQATVEASCLKDTGVASDISDLLPEVDRILLSLQRWRLS